MQAITKAKTLIHNGFNVVPVTAKGVPLKKLYADPETKTTPNVWSIEDADKWEGEYPNSNLALICGTNDIVALDIDVDNDKMVKAIVRWLKKEIPGAHYIRQCNNPRVALIFRKGETLSETKNGYSFAYRVPGVEYSDEQPGSRIEYLGHLKTLTIYGKHRKTGNPYRWGSKNPLDKVKVEDLPVLEYKHVSGLFSIYKKLVVKHFPEWEVSGKSSLTKVQSKQWEIDNRLTYSDDEVEKYIQQYDGNLRAEWIKAGMALHSHYKGSLIGLSIWDYWSQGFDKYEPGKCRSEWESFKVDGPVTMHTIVSSVKKEKKSPENLLERWLKRYVFIGNGSLVGDLESKVTESLLPIADARNVYANQTVPQENDKGEVSFTPVIKLWLTDPERKTCYDKIYIPGGERIIRSPERGTKKKYWNTYIPPTWEQISPEKKYVDLFNDQVDMLFGQEGSDGTDFFLTWLAQILQNPAQRYSVMPVHVSTYKGTGRGWLTKLIITLLGHQNTSETSITKMSTEGAKNGYLHESLFCVIPEVKEGGVNRYGVSEAVKKQITDDHLNVDVKYGAEGLQKIYTRFFFQSNHVDGLVLDEEERRFNVFAYHGKPKGHLYYETLYNLLDNELFMNSVYSFLMNYPVDVEKLTKPMETKARDRMIMSTKSTTAKAFLTYRSLCSVFHNDLINQFIEEYADLNGEEQFFINHKELNHLIKEYGINDKICHTLDSKGKKHPVKIYSFSPDVIPDNVGDLLNTVEETVENYFKQWR